MRRLIVILAASIAVTGSVAITWAQPFNDPHGSSVFTSSRRFNDDKALIFGTDSDYSCEFDTAQTPDAMICGAASAADVILDNGAWVSYDPAATSWSGDCSTHDNNGVAGCQRITDAAPQGLMLRPQPAFPGGTQTAADVWIFGGQDESRIAIDGADPSVTCADDNDTVTVTVVNSNGTSTATVLTEGTDWTATASVADTCSSLATAVDGVAGVSASCTSPNVRIQLDTATGYVTLAESTAACTTVTIGTSGFINLNTASGGANVTGVKINGRVELPGAGRIQWGSGGHLIGNLSATDGRFALSNNGETDYVQIDAAGTTKTITTDDGDLAVNSAGGDVNTTSRFASTLTAITVDAATTFAAVRNVHTVVCTDAETITTITGGASGMLLTLICLDADCTFTDTDDGGADTVDLTGTATNQVSADDLVIQLVHDGTSWREVGESAN